MDTSKLTPEAAVQALESLVGRAATGRAHALTAASGRVGILGADMSDAPYGPALGFLETSSIASGIEATDAMMKKADVELLLTTIVPRGQVPRDGGRARWPTWRARSLAGREKAGKTRPRRFPDPGRAPAAPRGHQGPGGGAQARGGGGDRDEGGGLGDLRRATPRSRRPRSPSSRRATSPEARARGADG